METIISENQFLDFEKEKTQTLTLNQLGRTYKENDVYGNPLRGIYHYDLLNKVADLAKEQGFKTEVYDLFAAQNRDRYTPGVVILPQVEAQYGSKAVEAHILRRVFANIRLLDLDDDTYTTNIAIAFHQKGIQEGFGNMVKICHNQCMLGADSYAATYSDKGQGRGKGMPIEQVLEAIKSWLMDARHIVIKERETIEQMKSIDVSADRMYQLIGLLTTMRVASDTSFPEIRSTETYPLNQSQISRFTEAMMLRYQQTNHISVWDVYNGATELYKADTMEIPALLPQNRAMSNFLKQQFNIYC